MLKITNLHAEIDGKQILNGLTLSVGEQTPSPRRGEGWGEGARRPRTTANARHPHPTLSLEGEGFRAQKLFGISLEGSVG
jgi:hypothetical protein